MPIEDGIAAHSVCYTGRKPYQTTSAKDSAAASASCLQIQALRWIKALPQNAPHYMGLQIAGFGFLSPSRRPNIGRVLDKEPLSNCDHSLLPGQQWRLRRCWRRECVRYNGTSLNDMKQNTDTISQGNCHIASITKKGEEGESNSWYADDYTYNIWHTEDLSCLGLGTHSARQRHSTLSRYYWQDILSFLLYICLWFLLEYTSLHRRAISE